MVALPLAIYYGSEMHWTDDGARVLIKYTGYSTPCFAWLSHLVTTMSSQNFWFPPVDRNTEVLCAWEKLYELGAQGAVSYYGFSRLLDSMRSCSAGKDKIGFCYEVDVHLKWSVIFGWWTFDILQRNKVDTTDRRRLLFLSRIDQPFG